MWIVVLFLINSLDSHFDGTHSLQRIHWWASDAMMNFSKSVLMKNQTHLHLGWPEGKYCKFLANFHFSVIYSFKGIFSSKKNLSQITQMFLATSLTTWNNSNWKYRRTFPHLAVRCVASMIGLLSECNKSVCTWPQHLIHRCVFLEELVSEALRESGGNERNGLYWCKWPVVHRGIKRNSGDWHASLHIL